MACLLAAAATVAGCASSSSTTTTTQTTTTAIAPATGTPTTAAPTTTTAPPSTSASSTSTPQSSAGSGSASSVEGVPAYQPSSVVSQAPHSLVLTSPDSVTKVGAFYSSTFAGNGWATVAKSVSRFSATFVVKKGNESVSLVVAPHGSGSNVAIATRSSP
jgi:hypothetical protein